MPDIENISVTMVRDDLSTIPAFKFPDPFSASWYRSGDENKWVEISRAADKYNKITIETFYKEFGRDTELLGARQFFIRDAEKNFVGTCTSWFNGNYKGQPFGRIHWVAIAPEMQGKGLAKPLMSLALNKLIELGHKRAYLVTSSARIPAISLYLKFGFLPELASKKDENIWAGISNNLDEQAAGLVRSLLVI